MNVTSSPGSRGERLVDEGDRADPAHRLRHRRLGLRVLQPAGLQPQQRRDRLEVVLHPVVDLADRRVLGHQHAVALADVGDVAHQQHAADDLAAGEDRHAAAQQRDVGEGLELLDHGQVLLVGLADHVVVEAELGQAHADGVGVDADPVDGRVGVGRQVADPRLGVEAHHAVADARRGRDGAAAGRVRERALGDHPGEAVEDRHVGALELARRAARPLDPLAGQDGDRRAVAVDGDGEHPGRVGQVLQLDVALHDLARAERARQHRRLGRVGEAADPVGVVHGLRGRRPHLADDQPAVVLRRHVQQQVGEAEVGQRVPLRGEPVEVRHLVAIEAGVVTDEGGERGHIGP